MSRPLVSVDVGGTLGHIDGPSLPALLAEASPLDPDQARHVLRTQLHTQPAVTPAVVANVCSALRVPVSAFPHHVEPAPLRLVPEAVAALRAMSGWATVVTLSNVTCLEAATGQLRDLLSPWVLDHFPSCSTGHAKPDPEAFRHVARARRSSTANMVHIGDDWACDVVGARSAGVAAVWVSNGRPVPDPDWLVDRGILVVADLLSASRGAADLAHRRWS